MFGKLCTMWLGDAQVFLKYRLSHGWQLFLSHYHLSLRLYLYLSLTLTHTDVWLRLCGFFDYKTLRDWSWFGFLALEERKISQISGLKGTTAACEEILSGKRGIERGRERAVFLKISPLMHWVSDRGGWTRTLRLYEWYPKIPCCKATGEKFLMAVSSTPVA